MLLGWWIWLLCLANRSRGMQPNASLDTIDPFTLLNRHFILGYSRIISNISTLSQDSKILLVKGSSMTLYYPETSSSKVNTTSRLIERLEKVIDWPGWYKLECRLWLPLVHRIKTIAHIPLTFLLQFIQTPPPRHVNQYKTLLLDYQRVLQSLDAWMQPDAWVVEQHQVACSPQSDCSFENVLPIAQSVLKTCDAWLSQRIVEMPSTEYQEYVYKAWLPLVESLHTSLMALIDMASQLLQARLTRCLQVMHSPWHHHMHIVLATGHMDQAGHWAYHYFTQPSQSEFPPFTFDCTRQDCSKNKSLLYITEATTITKDIELLQFINRHLVDKQLGKWVFHDENRMHRDVLGKASTSESASCRGITWNKSRCPLGFT